MPSRLPTKDDGLPGAYAIIPPANAQPATNILILLHGLGDSQVPFKSFAEKLQLPETACISLGGTANMPFDIDGAHWGDDIVFDNDSVIDPDAGFKASTNTVFNDVICKVLIDKCGYRPREIHIFGFGQGGMLSDARGLDCRGSGWIVMLEFVHG
jgi:predicted esterase